MVLVQAPVEFVVPGQPGDLLLQCFLGRLAAGVGTQEVGIGHHLHHAAAAGDRAQQRIVEVARVLHQFVRGRMAGDHRGARPLDHVAHALVGRVRDVDHHPQLVRAQHHRTPEAGEPGIGRRLAGGLVRRGTGAQRVVPHVGQAQVAHPALPGAVDCVQAAAQRVAVLDADHRRQHAVGVVLPHVGGRAGETDAVRVPCQQGFDAGIAALGGGDRRLVALRGQRSLLDIEDEERGVEPALLHLAQVDLEPGVGAGVVAVLLHVGARDVDVRVERERLGRPARHRQGERKRCGKCPGHRVPRFMAPGH